jgi:hypothetical protein
MSPYSSSLVKFEKYLGNVVHELVGKRDALYCRSLLGALVFRSDVVSLAIIGNGSSPSFSPGLVSPNSKKGLYFNEPAKQYKWNPHVC